VGSWPTTFNCLSFYPTIWTVIKETNKLCSREHFKKRAWTLIFQHHFKIVFKLLLRLAKILCRFRLNAWFFAYLIISSFMMIFDIFSSWNWASPIPWFIVFFNAYVVSSQIQQGYTYFVVFIKKNTWPHMMQFKILSPPLLGMLSSMFYANKTHLFSLPSL
jgi:hypothetical protein